MTCYEARRSGQPHPVSSPWMSRTSQLQPVVLTRLMPARERILRVTAAVAPLTDRERLPPAPGRADNEYCSVHENPSRAGVPRWAGPGCTVAKSGNDGSSGIRVVGRWCSVAESVRPPARTGPDATAVYALGSSHGESARLQRQSDELARDSAALLDRVAYSRGTAQSTSAAARAGFLTCWPRGCHREAGLSAWTLTRRTPPWRPSSPPGAG